MSMFFCKLVDDGIVVESFYREGKSANEVRKGLELFQWPKGDWNVEEYDAEDCDENES